MPATTFIIYDFAPLKKKKIQNKKQTNKKGKKNIITSMNINGFVMIKA